MRIRKNPISKNLLHSSRLPPSVAKRIKGRVFAVITMIGPGETLLRKVCRAVREGRPPEQSDMLRVVEGLEAILAGQSARKAFHLGQGRGRTSTPEYQLRDQKISAVIDALRQEGMTIAEAVEWVAAKTSYTEHAISFIYKQHCKKQRQIARSLKRDELGK